jgi:UDP-N-acetyl-D-mannosaminuronic acid transferase (WecB/TagA/CpsF family)
LYYAALSDSDILLPDGIALQTFYRLAHKKRLTNLNGTDFCPYFLEHAKEKYGKEKVNIILYGTYPDLLKKTEAYLSKK